MFLQPRMQERPQRRLSQWKQVAMLKHEIFLFFFSLKEFLKLQFLCMFEFKSFLDKKNRKEVLIKMSPFAQVIF